MKLFRIFLIILLFSFSNFLAYSQTQSLWSEIRKTKADSVGLNAFQYQVPLFGQHIDFFDPIKVKGTNDWAEPHEWVVRDFNNDDFADVFLAFACSEIESIPFILLIYNKNTGKFDDQSFRIKDNIGQTYNRKSIAADLNGDGILDIVAVSPPESVTCDLSYCDLILSSQDTTWTQKNLRIADRNPCEGYFHGVTVGDIDNDGDNDIVLANESCTEGSICYINDGKGNFSAKPVSTINRGQDFVNNSWTNELADINGDGCLDLFYWHDEKNTRILYGNCKETFDDTYQDLGPLKYSYVMDYDIRDLDGDEDFDLLLTTTNYTSGWQLVFLENKGNDSSGKVIWVNHTEEITQSLKIQGFYPDNYGGIFYTHIVDINNDGILDIIPQHPLSNIDSFYGQPEFSGQWILLGRSAWDFSYKKLPFAEPPKTITSTFVKGKINLSWNRVMQSYSPSDGSIDKWAIYVSDKNWGDRSQVSKPIVVSAINTKSENGFDQLLLDPTSKEMYIRISPIDSTGIEWPLSNMLKISNDIPISNAGIDQSINEGTTISLDGSGSIDILGNQLTYKWISPSGIILSSTISANPTFTAPEVKQNTNYIFSLIVNNGIKDSPADQVVITIKHINKLPIANAGLNRIVNEGTGVVLDGSGSYDPEGYSITYKWTAPMNIRLNHSTVVKSSFIASEVKDDSTLIFTLIVNDGLVDSEPSQITFTVKNIIKTGSEILGMNGLKIFPNPSTGIFKIVGLPQNQKNTILVYTIDGRLISKQKCNSLTETINLRGQVSGVYLLFVNNQSFKILKE